MSKETPVPDAETLGRLSEVAASTARRHLLAAKCLLEGEFWGQAHSLAVIAFEETGKAWLSIIAMVAPDELRTTFPFDDLGRDHHWKLDAANSVKALLALIRGGEEAPMSAAEAMADLCALARENNEAKKRGLYTDYSDGDVRSPAQVTEDQARAMVAVVEDVLDNAGPLIQFITALWASNNLPASVLSFLQQAADAVQSGEVAVIALVEQELRNTIPIVDLIKTDPEWVGDVAAIAEQINSLQIEAIPK